MQNNASSSGGSESLNIQQYRSILNEAMKMLYMCSPIIGEEDTVLILHYDMFYLLIMK